MTKSSRIFSRCSTTLVIGGTSDTSTSSVAPPRPDAVEFIHHRLDPLLVEGEPCERQCGGRCPDRRTWTESRARQSKDLAINRQGLGKQMQGHLRDRILWADPPSPCSHLLTSLARPLRAGGAGAGAVQGTCFDARPANGSTQVARPPQRASPRPGAPRGVAAAIVPHSPRRSFSEGGPQGARVLGFATIRPVKIALIEGRIGSKPDLRYSRVSSRYRSAGACSGSTLAKRPSGSRCPTRF